jgi:hypothetical protein
MAEPNVLLRGGFEPDRIDAERIQYVPEPGTVIKEFNGNRYDHFESTAETAVHGDRELAVFVWTACTYVAE